MLKKFLSSTREAKKKKEIENHVETELMSKVPFLHGADYTLISQLADAVTELDYAQGDTIFSEGEVGHSFYIVTKGAVSLSSNGETLAELGVGGCFGEGALLTEEVRGATATATEDSTLFELKRESFADLKEKYIKVRFRIKEMHAQRTAEGIKASIERNLLQNAPFLSGADSELINEMAQILERKKYSEGEVLIEEGQEGTTFYLVEAGAIGIQKDGKQIAELGPGACIGEGAMLSNRACSATVTALTETSCFAMRRSTFRNILSRYPVFAKKLKAIHEGRSE